MFRNNYIKIDISIYNINRLIKYKLKHYSDSYNTCSSLVTYINLSKN